MVKTQRPEGAVGTFDRAVFYEKFAAVNGNLVLLSCGLFKLFSTRFLFALSVSSSTPCSRGFNGRTDAAI